jgi:hypothetical protein
MLRGMLRRRLGPPFLVAAVVVVTWMVTGVALVDIVRFLAFDIAFVAAPGMALLWLLRGVRSSALSTIALAWPLGQTLEILAFAATAALGVRGVFVVYPLVVIIPCAVIIRKRWQGVLRESDQGDMSARLMWMAAAALSLGLVYLNLMMLPQAPLPGSSVQAEYADFPYFFGLIAQAMNHWPPATPGLSGVPLAYEWFVLFHIAAAGQVTGVPIPVIGLRLDYVPTIVVLGCQLLAVGRFISRSAATGVIAIAVLFLLGPLDLTTTTLTNGSPLADDVVVHLWDSWTFPFGLMFLLALLYLIIERLRTFTRPRGDLPSWVLMALLMIGASGAKATVLPDIIVGTGLFAIVHVLVRRKLPIPAMVSAALGVVTFLLTYLIVYSGNAPYTRIEPFAWLMNSAPVIYANLIHHTAARAIVLPIAYASGLAGTMLPLAGMLYLLRRRHRHRFARFALPISVFVAGVLISAAVHHISGSELYFQDTGYAAGCIVGADGLRLAWLDADGVVLPFSRRAVVRAFAAWIALLIVVVTITNHAVATPEATVLRYTAVTATAAVFVLIWAAVLMARRRALAGVVTLSLIPALAATALSSPLIVSPAVQRVLAGGSITSGPVVLTPDLLAALYWLRAHSRTDAVFAVNNHWVDAARTSGKFYYYTAFSGREVFIEPYNPYPISPGPGTPAGANFIYRQQVNNAVFDSANAYALHVMTRDYAVRYLLIDRTRGPDDPAVLDLGRVVFNNQDAAIVAVG